MRNKPLVVVVVVVFVVLGPSICWQTKREWDRDLQITKIHSYYVFPRFFVQCSYLLVAITLIRAFLILSVPFTKVRLSFTLGNNNLSNGNDNEDIALTTLTQLKQFFLITLRYIIIHVQLSLSCRSSCNCITNNDAVIIKK